MKRHVIGVYPDSAAAHDAVTRLIQEEIPRDRISVLQWADPDHGEVLLEYDQEERAEAINVGLWSGGALGAIAGLLAGAISVFTAGVGAVAILGPIATALGGATIGATVGGFVGSLMKLGLSREDAESLFEALKNGAIVVAVSTPTAEAHDVEKRLSETGASQIRIA